ncbi:hypothetical protein LA303_06505 [Candidatus Sulfidibacterium hydrothermale]|uniref:hypothetical protein n=1 Tax=Candidatus Sulfidibacterium hydrothermale TaxID=2875962 RepID=UPI001F0A1FC3|nr:hypothetical protein [Candidatus Sulfidibacterium hydrothermale]UBM61077.1 hypothetical protein LA303_06505 [Candidatus Sulfidibacterium hydrothermale]
MRFQNKNQNQILRIISLKFRTNKSLSKNKSPKAKITACHTCHFFVIFTADENHEKILPEAKSDIKFINEYLITVYSIKKEQDLYF